MRAGDRVDVFATFGGGRPHTETVATELEVVLGPERRGRRRGIGGATPRDARRRRSCCSSRATRPQRLAYATAFSQLTVAIPGPDTPRQERQDISAVRRISRRAPLAWRGPSPGEGATLSILQAIILGITQGVTEFAPISSSGHLILVPWLFDWSIVNDPALNKTFDVALHMGTLVGALVYFRQDIVRYLKAWFALDRAAVDHDARTSAWRGPS